MFSDYVSFTFHSIIYLLRTARKGGEKADPYMYLDGEGVKGRVLTPPGTTGEGEGEEEE